MSKFWSFQTQLMLFFFAIFSLTTIMSSSNLCRGNIQNALLYASKLCYETWKTETFCLANFKFIALCIVHAKLPNSLISFLNFSWNLFTKFKFLSKSFYRILHLSKLVVTVFDSPQTCKNKLLPSNDERLLFCRRCVVSIR